MRSYEKSWYAVSDLQKQNILFCHCYKYQITAFQYSLKVYKWFVLYYSVLQEFWSEIKSVHWILQISCCSNLKHFLWYINIKPLKLINTSTVYFNLYISLITKISQRKSLRREVLIPLETTRTQHHGRRESWARVRTSLWICG